MEKLTGVGQNEIVENKIKKVHFQDSYNYMENSMNQVIAYSEFYQGSSTPDSSYDEQDIDLDGLYQVIDKEILDDPVLFL